MLYLLIFVAYGLGLWIGRRDKTKPTTQWSSKYWGECRTCYPGVVMKFGANTKAHLEQVIRWHREDHHEPVMMHNPRFDTSLLNPYAGTYNPQTMDLKIMSLITTETPSLKNMDLAVRERVK